MLGYEFLRSAIVKNDYNARGVDIAIDEVFVSDGAKCDSGNIQEIFSLPTAATIIIMVIGAIGAVSDHLTKPLAASAVGILFILIPVVIHSGVSIVQQKSTTIQHRNLKMLSMRCRQMVSTASPIFSSSEFSSIYSSSGTSETVSSLQYPGSHRQA